MLDAGRRDRRIRIERLTETGRDDFNAPVMDWVLMAQCWAHVREYTGFERNMAEQRQGQASTVFTVLWTAALSSVNPKDRVAYSGRLFDIDAVAERGRREELIIAGRAQVDGDVSNAD